MVCSIIKTQGIIQRYILAPIVFTLIIHFQPHVSLKSFNVALPLHRKQGTSSMDAGEDSSKSSWISGYHLYGRVCLSQGRCIVKNNSYRLPEENMMLLKTYQYNYPGITCCTKDVIIAVKFQRDEIPAAWDSSFQITLSVSLGQRLSPCGPLPPDIGLLCWHCAW